jgi:hypothetical protein
MIAALSAISLVHRLRYTWTRTEDASPAAAKAGQAAQLVFILLTYL